MAVSDLLWRYAVKRFDSTRTIDSETWAQIEQSLVVTPSSFGLQPWKFIVVENTDLRDQLRAQSWNQPQVTDASHLIVLAAKEVISTSDIHDWINCLALTQQTPIDQVSSYS